MSEVKSREQILAGVREVLVEALAVEPEEVHEEAVLVDDLGLASIDMLDMIFSLNQEFGVYIKPTEIQTQLLGGLSEEEFLNEDRTVSEKGYQRIAELVPGFDRSGLDEDLTDGDLFQFFRVKHVVDIVEEKLAERAGSS